MIESFQRAGPQKIEQEGGGCDNVPEITEMDRLVGAKPDAVP